jgi:glycosyltransferase involved in cell wall biosynthesis
MIEGYVKKEKRKKILFLGDDLRMHSGIATMSREVVLNSAHRFNWVQLAGGLNHPEKGKRLDLSADTNNMIGITDASVILYPTDGYGNPDMLRQIIEIEKPDAIMIFTDPRYYVWLFDMEAELRKKCPITYLSIWDCPPAPLYNKSYYEACDALMCISKQTKVLSELVLGDKAKGKFIKYVPHGIDQKTFYPINEFMPESSILQEFKQSIFGSFTPEFTLLYNARNIRRKSVSDLITAWSVFTDSIGKEKAKKCALVLHTQALDEHGTDLPKVIELLCDPSYQKVFIVENRYTPQHMNLLYNIADATALVSSNEGWGLSLTESMMAGKMIIGNVTGGMQDQMRFKDKDGKWFTPTKDMPSNHFGTLREHGEWAVPVFPTNMSLVGSIPTPYIWDDRCDFRDIAKAINLIYELSPEERQKRGLAGRTWATSDEAMMTAKHMADNISDCLQETIDTFKPRKQFELLKIEQLPIKKIPHPIVY